MQIKIGIRNNLLYPFLIIIFTSLRKIDSIIMNFIEFRDYLLLTLIMFLSEFISGFFILLYLNKNISEEKTVKNMGFKLINTKLNRPDSNLKIYFLIFMAAYFDFFVFIIQIGYLPYIKVYLSISLDIRLRSSLVISSAFICYYFLRINIYKHQKFSLFIVCSCLIIVIISEYLFEVLLKGGNENEFIIVLLFILINYIFNSFLDVIEKYLLEVDNIDVFKMLMLEGIFDFIFTIIYSFFQNSFIKTKYFYDNNGIKIILIFCFIFYFITSGGRNVYRIMTNKLYSPMARTLTDCFLDPLFIIYYYFCEKDFIYLNNTQNIYYFFLNLIISIITVFCGCVYNELFIIFCCNLEHETYHKISERAIEKNENLNELGFEIDDNYYIKFKDIPKK